MATETSNEAIVELELLDYDGSGNASYLSLGAVNANATHGDDLAGLITGFVDDSRVRGGKDASSPNDAADLNKFHTLSQSERQAESDKLRTKGGWRDHTDGNRITTTRGDKVEVIRGNYKLLVLGREQWNNDENDNPCGVGLNYESSGGITYHFDEVPGQYVDVRWQYDATVKTWRCIEDTVQGATVDRFHGTDMDWMTGGDVVTRIGSLIDYDNATNRGTPDANDPDHFVDDPDFDTPDNAAHISAIWPSTTEPQPLPNVKSEVFATDVEERAIARKIRSYLGSSERPLDEFYTYTHVTELLEDNYYTSYEANMTGGAAIEMWAGALYFELFLGANESIKHAWFWDLRGGSHVVEVNLGGAIAEANLAFLKMAHRTALAGFVDFVAAPATVEWTFGLVFAVDVANPFEVAFEKWELSANLIRS